MKSKLLSLLVVLTLVFSVSIGCKTIYNGTKLSIEVVETVCSTALEAAASVLAAEGTQVFAIAVAQSCIESKIEDPETANALGIIVAQAIPQLANGIAEIFSKKEYKEQFLTRKKIYHLTSQARPSIAP